jgi:hypothetical protein
MYMRLIIKIGSIGLLRFYLTNAISLIIASIILEFKKTITIWFCHPANQLVH